MQTIMHSELNVRLKEHILIFYLTVTLLRLLLLGLYTEKKKDIRKFRNLALLSVQYLPLRRWKTPLLTLTAPVAANVKQRLVSVRLSVCPVVFFLTSMQLPAATAAASQQRCARADTPVVWGIAYILSYRPLRALTR